MEDSIYFDVVRGWEAIALQKFPRARFHWTGETGSTNDDLIALLRQGKGDDYELVAADYQTSGRGRRGDRWEAQAGRNLLVSLALPLGDNRANWTRIPLLAAMALGQCFEDRLGPGVPVEAKWPNDILVGGKKLAGILVETVIAPRPYAVVGFGINVNMRIGEFPADLRERATSLSEILSRDVDRWGLLGSIVQNFIGGPDINETNFEPVLHWIRKRDYLAGRTFRIVSGHAIYSGIGAGIGQGGELLLRTPDGETRAIVSAAELLLC